jgi:hypothetical protein
MPEWAGTVAISPKTSRSTIRPGRNRSLSLGSPGADKRHWPVICATARGLMAPAFVQVTIFAARLRSLPAIVEIRFPRISDRPPAGAAVQGQGRYEFSVGQRSRGLDVDAGRWNSQSMRLRRGQRCNARPVRRILYKIFFRKLSHRFFSPSS